MGTERHGWRRVEAISLALVGMQDLLTKVMPRSQVDKAEGSGIFDAFCRSQPKVFVRFLMLSLIYAAFFVRRAAVFVRRAAMLVIEFGTIRYCRQGCHVAIEIKKA
jgi:hypothetical protein